MTNPYTAHHRNVSDAYRTSSYHGLSQREAMAEVLRTLISHLYAAKDAYEVRKLDVMCDYNSKTLRIVAILRDTIQASGAMKDAEAAPHASRLSNQYHQLFMRLTNILRAEDIPAEYDVLIDLLRPLYHAWEKSSQSMDKPSFPASMLL